MSTWTSIWPFSAHMQQLSNNRCASSSNQLCTEACVRVATTSKLRNSRRPSTVLPSKRQSQHLWASWWNPCLCATTSLKESLMASKEVSRESLVWLISKLTLVWSSAWPSGRKYTSLRGSSYSKIRLLKSSLINSIRQINSWSKSFNNSAKQSRPKNWPTEVKTNKKCVKKSSNCR